MIIFLSILCISLAISAIIMFRIIIFLLHEDNNKITKESIKEYFERNAVEGFYCKNLILFASLNEALSGSQIYDFSTFEENGNIGLIYCYDTKRIKNILGNEYEFDDDDDNLYLCCFKNQTIYKLKDGSYQWDISNFV